MTLETLIADAVERGVLAAMSKLNAGQHLTTDPTTVAEVIVSVPPVTKKPGRKRSSVLSTTLRAKALCVSLLPTGDT